MAKLFGYFTIITKVWDAVKKLDLLFLGKCLQWGKKEIDKFGCFDMCADNVDMKIEF